MDGYEYIFHVMLRVVGRWTNWCLVRLVRGKKAFSKDYFCERQTRRGEERGQRGRYTVSCSSLPHPPVAPALHASPHAVGHSPWNGHTTRTPHTLYTAHQYSSNSSHRGPTNDPTPPVSARGSAPAVPALARCSREHSSLLDARHGLHAGWLLWRGEGRGQRERDKVCATGAAAVVVRWGVWEGRESVRMGPVLGKAERAWSGWVLRVGC